MFGASARVNERAFAVIEKEFANHAPAKIYI
jgi:hypothetical protein